MRQIWDRPDDQCRCLLVKVSGGRIQKRCSRKGQVMVDGQFYCEQHARIMERRENARLVRRRERQVRNANTN